MKLIDKLRSNIRVRLRQSGMRHLRSRLPFPQLWALGFGSSVPSRSFSASDSILSRPESISRSHGGNRVVVSNTESRSITVFDLKPRLIRSPRVRLNDMFIDEDKLEYAHGAVFSPDDSSVFALGEYAHTMIAYSLTDPVGESASRVLWVLRGPEHGLENPADLAVHPGGKWIVVANRLNTGLSVFRLDESNVGAAPHWLNNHDVAALNLLGVSAPHGVAFSHCGEFLFVTHKPYFLNPEDTGKSAVSVYRCSERYPTDLTWESVDVLDYGSAQLHHIAAHPNQPLVAVTNSQGDADILRWSAGKGGLEKRGSIDIFRVGEGAKGIEFTATGEHLMITTELNEILFFRVSRYL